MPLLPDPRQLTSPQEPSLPTLPPHALFPSPWPPSADPKALAEPDPNWSDTNLAGLVPPLVEPVVKEPDTLPEIVGRYRILGIIAKGGMGVVLRAYDPQLGRELAVKIMRACKIDSEQQRRFLEEAQISSRLQHPGIVPLHELGRDANGRPFLAMKLIEGRTLAELLTERPSPTHDLARFLHVFEQICQTMAYAHSKGVVHRDLKPLNVMVGAFGEVQVMDWGLAKATSKPAESNTDAARETVTSALQAETPLPFEGMHHVPSETREGTVIGTLAYMSPEQARGEIRRVSPATDVFGLGAILCEILTGVPPFEGGGWMATLHKVQRGELTDAWKRLEACPAEAPLKELARACLAPVPEDRPAHAQEVAARISAYLAGVQERLRRTELERAQALIRVEQEHRARRLTAALAGMAVLLAIGFIGGGWWLSAQSAFQRATADNALRQALSDARVLQAQGQFAGALAALKQTDHALAQAAPSLRATSQQLRIELEQQGRTARLLADLELAQLSKTVVRNDTFDVSTALEGYTEAFGTYGLAVETTPVAEVARILREHSHRELLCAIIDDWAYLKKQARQPRAAWIHLWAIAAAADNNPWRERLRQALQQSPVSVQKLRDLAKEADLTQPLTSLRLLELALENRRDSGRMTALWQQAYVKRPNDFWVNYSLGRSLLHQERPQYQDALRFYTAAVSLRPESPGASLNLGYVLAQLERYAEAEAIFRRALEMAPNYAMAHYNLAVCRVSQGDHLGAIPHFDRAIQLKPNWGRSYIGRGRAYTILDKNPEAIADLRRGAALEPRSLDGMLAAGQAARIAGQVPAAIQQFRRTVERFPKSHSAWFYLGSVYLCIDDYGNALPALLESDRLKPEEPNLVYNLGIALEGLGRHEEALQRYRQRTRMKPELPLAYMSTGFMLMRSNRLADALPVLEKGLALGLLEKQRPHRIEGTLRDCRLFIELEKRLDAVRTDMSQVKDAEECLNFARYCWWCRSEYATAMRFWEAALQRQPPLDPVKMAQHRRFAAGAALRAAAGEGVDAASVMEAERQRWRNAARQWLKAELQEAMRLLQGPTESQRRATYAQLYSWQFAQDLVSVRDPVHLEKLPPAEQAAWRKLWSEIVGLVDQLTREMSRELTTSPVPNDGRERGASSPRFWPWR